MFCLSIMCLIASRQNSLNKKRLDAMEIRLRNMEHLLSLSISESRSPAFIGGTNRVSTSADAPREGINPQIK